MFVFGSEDILVTTILLSKQFQRHEVVAGYLFLSMSETGNVFPLKLLTEPPRPFLQAKWTVPKA